MPTNRHVFETNEREVRRRLARHHFTLAMGVAPVVDTRPPICMYKSPKSVHYRPSVKKRSQSMENLPPAFKQQSQARNVISQTFGSSHNIYAIDPDKSTVQQMKRVSSSKEKQFLPNAYVRWLASINSRLRDSPNYQPPTKPKVRNATSTSSSYSDNTSMDSMPSSSSCSKSDLMKASLPPISLHKRNEKSTASENKNDILHHQVAVSDHRRSVRWLNNDDDSNTESHASCLLKDPEEEHDNYDKNRTSETDSYYANPNRNHIAHNPQSFDESSTHLNIDEPDDDYLRFKEQALNMILLRGLFTNRVIKDCFRRQMRRNSHLDTTQMERVMRETMQNLGISVDYERNITEKRETTSRSSSSVSSSGVSSTPSRVIQSSTAVTLEVNEKLTDKPNTNMSHKSILTSRSFSFDNVEAFPLDAPPPAKLSMDDDSL